MVIKLGEHFSLELESIDSLTPALGFKVNLLCTSNNHALEYSSKSVWLENSTWLSWLESIDAEEKAQIGTHSFMIWIEM